MEFLGHPIEIIGDPIEFLWNPIDFSEDSHRNLVAFIGKHI